MFKRRLSKLGRAVLLVACLFFVSGLQQSCKDWLDDYKYDDSEPDWLGESIYAFLQEGSPNHTYRNYVELIDSLGEQATLEKTGSKTLFVADDAAFDNFYANNPWGVKSVAEMTVAQRKLLFYNTMLPNAILLDMMPSTTDRDTDAGNRMSQATEFNPVDSVTSLHADYYGLHPSWPTYNKYWKFLEDTAYFALAPSSMVYFFDEYLKRNAISVSDVDFIFSKSGATSKNYKKGDVFLFGNKLVDSDVDTGNFSEDSLTIVCKNGYIYRMDEVLLPPMDMASELRIHKDTRIFSHLLDRFCYPSIDTKLSDKYNEYHENTEKDTVYSLRYLTTSLFGESVSEIAIATDPMHPAKNKNKKVLRDESLDYDPGQTKGVNDIYAMLVPKDECLYEYFADEENGAGNFLIKRYAPDVEVEQNYSEEAVAKLLTALDSVPQTSIAEFINNLMQPSFAGAVPSKFDRVVNDASDEMGVRMQHIDECVIANNGVLYLLNEVFSPAKYSSVAGPVQIYENMSIMNRFISDLKYDYYLLAMDAKYSLIIPDNNNFVYYNPITIDKNTKEQTMYSYHYDGNRKENSSKTPELWYEEFTINTETSEIIDTLDNKTGYDSNIATDLLEYLIVVHDKVEPEVHANRMYYSTKGYGTVKIDASDPENIKFYGGEQLEKGTEILDSMMILQQNGVTFSTKSAEKSTESVLYSSIPTPPTKSVYENMLAHGKAEDELYYEFFKLCYPGATTLSDALVKIYGGNALDVPDDTLKMYSIFYTDNDMENGVSFFNTYHYTVYIPSNDAIKELYANGLPTWEFIEKEAEKNPQRAMSLIRLVNNVARYHFQDQSVYHDKSRFFLPNIDGTKKYEVSLGTSLINPLTGRFYDMVVKSDENNSTIHVKDEWVKMSEDEETFKGFREWAAVNNTDWAQVINTPAENENKTWNVMCRDIKVGTDPNNGKRFIRTSSYSVLQPIDRALLNKNMFGYDCRFRRFAETGERVDTMYVSQGQGGNVGFGQETYLVGKAGRIPRSTENAPQPKELENAEIAYLMQPITEGHESWIPNVSHEVLVYEPTVDEKAEKQAILITRDGYRVKKNKIEKGNKTYIVYAYHTVTDDKGDEYIIKVNNAGEEIERILFKANEVESPETENNGSEVENGSNGETNDKE